MKQANSKFHLNIFLDKHIFGTFNPNPDGEGVYDFRNFEEIQLKMAWSKSIFFYPRPIPHKTY